MTEDQFRLWKNFAIRMAVRAFPRYRKANRRRIARLVKRFLRQKCGDPEWVARIESWDHTSSRYPEGDPRRRGEWKGYVCDEFSEFRDAMFRPRQLPVCEMDGDLEDEYRYRRHDVWGGPVACCLRAGLDMASEPSAGVVGFTAGDLRRMYRGKLPDWLENSFWHRPWDDKEGQCSYPVKVSAMADDHGVWL